MTENGDVLARFHRTLVEEIRAQRPEYLDGPFTVAEIYQNLVPYGTHRDRLGIEMNGDYEDALLRLLSGEGGYLVLESDAALRALREEAESSNPNTGLYREYAALDVRLDPEHLASAAQDEAGEGDGSEHDAGEADASGDDGAPVSTEEETGTEARAPLEFEHVEAASDSDGEPGGSCKWCRADLPDRPNLRFCPFCGTDVRFVPCPTCGEEIEPNWRFCIACGTEVTV